MTSERWQERSVIKVTVVWVVLALGVAACEWPSGEPEMPLLEGNPALPQCGFSMTTEPTVPVVDPCSEGVRIFGPEVFTRELGAPVTEVRTFTVAEPGAICIRVENQSNSSAKIELDGVEFVSPSVLNPHVQFLTRTSNVSAGSHDLSVTVASSPSSGLVVEARFAKTDVTQQDRVVGDMGKLAVWGLAATPDPFTPSNFNGINDTTTFSAAAHVLPPHGSPNFLYGLHYAFQVTDPSSCEQIRELEGFIPLDPAVQAASIPFSADWDGLNDSGDLVAEGTYFYRTVVRIYRRNAGGVGQVLDGAASLVRTVTVSSNPSIDEPDLGTLEEVPPEIVQAIPPFANDTPLEVDEPVYEQHPPGDADADGDQGAVCFLADCDTDGDGYAARRSGCRIDLPPEITGGKSLCPEGYVQYHEPDECDQIMTNQDEIDFWNNRVRPDMAQNWITRFTLAGYWNSNYAKHHPRRFELPDNFVDDNCNGLIDETEIIYAQKGRSSAPGEISVRLNVNDKRIRNTANVLVSHVIDLADIDCPGGYKEVDTHEALQALRVGEFSWTHAGSGVIHSVGPVLQRSYYWYWGDRETEIDIAGLPLGTGAYAVALTFHRLAITSLSPIEVEFEQLKCVEPNGTVTSNTTCDLAGRIASRVYFTVTGRNVHTEERLRRNIANRALFEWSLSERLGLVGGPENAGAIWPDGTRYDASYGESWCTEFPAMLFRWNLLQGSSFGYATNVADMVEKFRDEGWIELDAQARESMSILDPWQYGALGPALPGDYVALATHEEDKKTHSSVFLWNSGVGGNWKIGGNEHRRVKMTCNDNYGMAYGRYNFQALGHISNLQPAD